MRLGAPSRSRIATIVAATLAVALLSACDEPAPPAAAIRPVRVVTVEPLMSVKLYPRPARSSRDTKPIWVFGSAGKFSPGPSMSARSSQRGDLLARLDDQRARSQLQSAQAGLAAAEAELTRAQAEEARQSALLKDGFTTKQRYDTAVRDLQMAEAQRDSAQAKSTLARENLGYTELHSEVDGIVTAVYAEAGQVVAAGQHVLRVAEPREQKAVFDVPEGAFRLVPHASISSM
jgi:biotin carboxyl carrier protein